jgi:phosphatidylserine decarboxylase
MRIPIASDAWRFVVPLLAASAILLWIDRRWSVALAVVGLAAVIFCLFFFRDFNRTTVINERLIYSPGDGKILEVAAITEGPYIGRILVRIFLSVLDGHVQRAPATGKVKSIQYKKGLFLDARDPQAHVQNEQNELTLNTSRGDLVITQIAGLIARRILCWTREGAELAQGERYGLIRFGSQVDVVMPASCKVLVQAGDRVIGGLSVLAEWQS